MLHANVAILESNEQFAQELKQFFAENTDLNVCGVSDDGIAGVDMIQNTNPDVILLSLILKGSTALPCWTNCAKAAKSTA